MSINLAPDSEPILYPHSWTKVPLVCYIKLLIFVSSLYSAQAEEILKHSTKTESFMKKRKQTKIPKASKKPKVETEIMEPFSADSIYSSQNVENLLNLNTEIPSKNTTIIKVPDLAKLPQNTTFVMDDLLNANKEVSKKMEKGAKQRSKMLQTVNLPKPSFMGFESDVHKDSKNESPIIKSDQGIVNMDLEDSNRNRYA